MASEISVQNVITIRNGTLRHQTQGGSYRLDMASVGGPTPGMLSVPTTGIDIDLSELSSVGLCELTNLDSTNSVDVGIHDGSLFHPFMRLPPGGKPFTVPLSPEIGVEEDVPGTGTSAVVNTLFLRGVGGTCKVVVNAFEA